MLNDVVSMMALVVPVSSPSSSGGREVRRGRLLDAADADLLIVAKPRCTSSWL
jgi:hypothetical protein